MKLGAIHERHLKALTTMRNGNQEHLTQMENLCQDLTTQTESATLISTKFQQIRLMGSRLKGEAQSYLQDIKTEMENDKN